MKMITVDYNLNYKHYGKDVGMIPYILEKNHSWSCTIIGPNTDESYCKVYDDYNVKAITPVKSNDLVNDIANFIGRNAKDYDVLNLYHLNTRNNLKVILKYKIKNPNGIVYLKLDMGKRGLWLCEKDNPISRIGKLLLLHLSDVVSDENSYICKKIEKIYNKKIEYIPNGWYGCTKKNYKNRNIDFLYVGRIGVYEKGVDVLLDAFAKMDNNNDTKLHLVGKVEESYAAELKTWLNKFSELNDRIIFHGEVRNKEELFKIYDNANILIVPSRWESFGIVMVEALSHGCYIICSDAVSSSNDIINQYTGITFNSEDSSDLAIKMSKANKKQIIREKIYEMAEDYSWEKIVNHLEEILSSKNKSNLEKL